MKTENIRFESLANGLVRGFDRASGLSGLWLKNGTPYAGDLAMMAPDALLVAMKSVR